MRACPVGVPLQVLRVSTPHSLQVPVSQLLLFAALTTENCLARFYGTNEYRYTT